MTVQELIDLLQTIEDKSMIVLRQEFESGYNPIEDYIIVTVYDTESSDCIHGRYEYHSESPIKAIIF